MATSTVYRSESPTTESMTNRLGRQMCVQKRGSDLPGPGDGVSVEAWEQGARNAPCLSAWGLDDHTSHQREVSKEVPVRGNLISECGLGVPLDAWG